MAGGATNWLSFSLFPMEMLRSSEPEFTQYDAASLPNSTDISHHHHPSNSYFLDNFYAKNGWGNQGKEQQPQGMAEQSLFLTSYVDSSQNHLNHAPPHVVVPKLEDFFGDSSSSMMHYSDSQTETQDSSLTTQMYDHGGPAAYFGGCGRSGGDQQDLKAVAGFQAFSAANSGSEVDDSASVGRVQQPNDFGTRSVDSSGNELAFSGGGTAVSRALSLGVSQSLEKTVAVSDSDSSKKIADNFGQRTSIYRGVTRHRWTGRYEAHLWDNSCRREGQARKGRQVYLGGYDKEEKAARSYDLAALKYWGPTATTNFPVSNYTKELEEMKHVAKQEFIASLRRKSSGFSRGASIYRGVTRHHQQGRWQARIGRVAGNKDLYLGTFATEEEAAEAYDVAAIKFRGANAVTNFEMSRYDVEAIMKSSLPVGGAAKRLKLSLESEQKPSLTTNTSTQQQPQCENMSGSSINFSAIHQPVASIIPCRIPFDSAVAAAYYHHNLFHHFHPANTTATAESALTSSTNAGGYAALPPPPQTEPEFFIWPHQTY